MDNMIDKFEFGKHEIILEKKLNNHINGKNPHSISKYDIGLGNVENIAPSEMPLSSEGKAYADKSAWVIEAVETSITGGEFEIKLKDNNGNVISKTLINTDSEYAIQDVELDMENKQLVFHRGVGVDDLYCDISELVDSQKSDVSEERKRAEEAEEELLEAINAETTRAKKKEDDLGSSINKVAADLAAEISDRGTADSQLSNNLMIEQNRASNRENELESKINAEANRAQEAENNLTQALNNERDSRKNEDNILLTRLRNVAEYLDDRISDIYLNEGSGEESGVLINKLNEEKYLREQGDSLLTQRINDEVRAAQEREDNLDQKFTGLVTEEANKRYINDSALQNNLNKEVQDRKNAITQEVTDRNAAIKLEADRAKEVEGTITTNLNSEVERASEAESGLSTRLSTVEAKAAMNITSTQIANWENEVGAKQEISNLANGQVKSNKEAIEAINDSDTGILKNAKDYTDSAINNLDVSDITGFGADKTLATLTESDGKISAIFQDIAITLDKVTDVTITAGELNTYETRITSVETKSSDNAIAIEKINDEVLPLKADLVAGVVPDYELPDYADILYYNKEQACTKASDFDKILAGMSIGDVWWCTSNREPDLQSEDAEIRAGSIYGQTFFKKIAEDPGFETIQPKENALYIYVLSSSANRAKRWTGNGLVFAFGSVINQARDSAQSTTTSVGTAYGASFGVQNAKDIDTINKKLADIEDGAEVNVIDTIKLNGSALSVTDKTVDIVLPDADEYNLTKQSDNVYRLIKNGQAVGDAINIPKDLVVKEGYVVKEDEKTYIRLVLNDEAEDTIDIEVDSLVDIYESGDGIIVDNTERTISFDDSILDPIYDGLDNAQEDIQNLTEGSAALRGRVLDIEQTLDGIGGTDWNNGKLKYFFNKLNGLTKDKIDALFALIDTIEYEPEEDNTSSDESDNSDLEPTIPDISVKDPEEIIPEDPDKDLSEKEPDDENLNN